MIFYGDESEVWLPINKVKPFVENFERYKDDHPADIEEQEMRDTGLRQAIADVKRPDFLKLVSKPEPVKSQSSSARLRGPRRSGRLGAGARAGADEEGSGEESESESEGESEGEGEGGWGELLPAPEDALLEKAEVFVDPHELDRACGGDCRRGRWSHSDAA